MTASDPATEARRAPVVIRLRGPAIDRLDQLAYDHSLAGQRVSRSDVIRACLSVALKHDGELARTIAQLRDGI